MSNSAEGARSIFRNSQAEELGSDEALKESRQGDTKSLKRMCLLFFCSGKHLTEQGPADRAVHDEKEKEDFYHGIKNATLRCTCESWR